jgi:hypothetical protein
MEWQASIVPGYSPEGKPIISVIAKRTYLISQNRAIIADDQVPVQSSDIPSDPQNPMNCEMLYESDTIAYKPKTDVVVLCKAHASQGTTVCELETAVSIGPLNKKIMVYGNRKIENRFMKGLTFTDPEPFTSIDISYSNAFGGRAVMRDGGIVAYPPNPLGKGFHFKATLESADQIQVPNCEDIDSPLAPEHLLIAKFEEWKDLPVPASYGWTRQFFFPRYTYAGIIPEMLSGTTQKAPELNPNTPRLDFRFYQGASEGMGDFLLNGNEPVKLYGLDPEYPVFEFKLPGDIPKISLCIGDEKFPLQPQLQTVFIDKESGGMILVWRGFKECSLVNYAERGRIVSSLVD